MLNQLLNGAEKVNGIYLLDNRIGFAPYDSFETGVQDADTFAQGGLARALEYTTEKTAPKLLEIASRNKGSLSYKGVCVDGFDETKEKTLGIVHLCHVSGFGYNVMLWGLIKSRN